MQPFRNATIAPHVCPHEYNIGCIVAKGNSFCRLSLSLSLALSFYADCRISWNKAILLKARSKGSFTLLILMKFLRLDDIGRFTFTLHKYYQFLSRDFISSFAELGQVRLSYYLKISGIGQIRFFRQREIYFLTSHRLIFVL